jgi:hypothetical protein
MKIEFTRDEIEAIILAHIKNEIAPYTTFVRNEDNGWGLPESITLYSKEKNAAQ